MTVLDVFQRLHNPFKKIARASKPGIEDSMNLIPADEEKQFFLQKDNTSEGQNRQTRGRYLPSQFCYAISATLTTIIIIIIITIATASLLTRRHPLSFQTMPSNEPSNNIMLAPCGSSHDEAIAKGCKLDLISFSWLPDACYDVELSSTFASLQNWEWYSDVNKTRIISRQEALSGVHPVLFVDWEYHLTHCTYMWRKMHRAILGPGRKALDSYIGSMAHTEHCEHMLLKNRDRELGFVNTGIRVKYPDCGIA